MPAIVFPPTLRQAGGQAQWMPVGFRGRGLPGSGGNYDSSNTTVQDQTVFQAPSWGAIRALKLGYAGFDITNMGEVDRVAASGADNPVTTLTASVTSTSRAVAFTTTSSIASGATTLTFSLVASGTPWNAAKKGQFVAGVSQIPTGTYVTGVNFTFSSGDTMATVAISLSAATTGTIAAGTQITFQGDITPARFGTLQSGQIPTCHDFVWSDPINVSVAAGGLFAVRTFRLYSAAGIQAADYPGSGGSNSSRILPADNAFQYEFSYHSTSGTDHTRTNATFSNSGYGFLGPDIILGLVDGPAMPGVLLLGDSIGAGTGDNPDTYANCRRQGWFQKSLGNNLPWISLARGSTTILECYSSGLGQFAAAVGTGITDVVLQFCNNDLFTGGLTAAQCLSNLQAIAAPFQAMGIRVWVCTAFPRTYSSDGWTTLTNQAFLSGASNSCTTTITSNLSAGATVLPVASATGITVGQCVSGPGAPSGCVVSSISGTNITLSAALTSSATSGQGYVFCGAEQQRRLFNTAVRTSFASYGFYGVIDPVATCESTTFLGYWAMPTGGGAASADGVHPAPAWHSAIVAAGAITPAQFYPIPSNVY